MQLRQLPTALAGATLSHLRQGCGGQVPALLLSLIATVMVTACSTSGVSSARRSCGSLSGTLVLPEYVRLERLPDVPGAGCVQTLFKKHLPEASRLLVLVHGFGGHPEETWGAAVRLLTESEGASDSPVKGSVAPLSSTQQVNILPFAHSAGINADDVERAAHHLLRDLDLARDRCSCKDSYIVAHSLGTLIAMM